MAYNYFDPSFDDSDSTPNTFTPSILYGGFRENMERTRDIPENIHQHECHVGTIWFDNFGNYEYSVGTTSRKRANSDVSDNGKATADRGRIAVTSSLQKLDETTFINPLLLQLSDMKLDQRPEVAASLAILEAPISSYPRHILPIRRKLKYATEEETNKSADLPIESDQPPNPFGNVFAHLPKGKAVQSARNSQGSKSVASQNCQIVTKTPTSTNPTGGSKQDSIDKNSEDKSLFSFSMPSDTISFLPKAGNRFAVKDDQKEEETKKLVNDIGRALSIQSTPPRQAGTGPSILHPNLSPSLDNQKPRTKTTTRLSIWHLIEMLADPNELDFYKETLGSSTSPELIRTLKWLQEHPKMTRLLKVLNTNGVALEFGIRELLADLRELDFEAANYMLVLWDVGEKREMRFEVSVPGKGKVKPDDTNMASRRHERPGQTASPSVLG